MVSLELNWKNVNFLQSECQILNWFKNQYRSVYWLQWCCADFHQARIYSTEARVPTINSFSVSISGNLYIYRQRNKDGVYGVNGSLVTTYVTECTLLFWDTLQSSCGLHRSSLIVLHLPTVNIVKSSHTVRFKGGQKVKHEQQQRKKALQHIIECLAVWVHGGKHI